ncbi:hypothetical protein D9M72_393340 [compost metagenome]
MKTFFKALGWLVAIALVFLLYVASDNATNQRWGMAIAIGYCFWLITKQITDAENRAQARFNQLEEMIRRQADAGLSLYQSEGLSGLIRDHQAARREVDQP